MLRRNNNIDNFFSAFDLLQSQLKKADTIFSNRSIYDRHPICFFPETSPRADVCQEGNNQKIRIVIPGVSKDSVNITVQGNHLEIHAPIPQYTPPLQKEKKEDEGKTTPTFSKKFTLPAGIAADKIEATLENGILTVTLPKSEKEKAKQITIN